MATITQPTLIPRPWAENGARENIPDTTTQFGRASWSAGFPGETARALNAGGIPPNWLDFQGVLYALSQHAVFEQAGGRYAWQNDINYPIGACIIGSDNVVYQAVQESGPGTAAGAKDPASSGNSAYWTTQAGPDGTTIRLVNGKLSVNLATIADGATIITANNKLSVSPAGIADGTTIVVDANNKLKAVGGGGGGGGSDASDLADNRTIIASNNKLTVNLSNTPPSYLNNITPYLIKATGGLAVEQSSGKIKLENDPVYTTGDQDIAGLKDFTGTVHTKAFAGTAVEPTTVGEIDMSEGTMFVLDVDQDTEINIINVPEGAVTASIIITDGGSHSVAWPSNIHWPQNTTPSLSSTGTDMIILKSPNSGTEWYGEAILYGLGGDSSTYSFIIETTNITSGEVYLPFIMKNASSDNSTRALTVDWGDGNLNEYTPFNLSLISQKHNYNGNTAQKYTITITARVSFWKQLMWYMPASSSGGYILNPRVGAILVPIPPLSGTKRGSDKYSNKATYMFWNYNGLTSVCPEVFKYMQPTGLKGTFLGCDALQSLPSNVFSGCSDVTTMEDCFRSSGLTTANRQWFADCYKATDLSYCFEGCPSSISIPKDLLWDLGISEGVFLDNNIDLKYFLEDWNPSTASTLWIRYPKITTASHMFGTNKTGPLTVKIPAATTTATTLVSAMSSSGYSWITFDAVNNIETDPNAPT